MSKIDFPIDATKITQLLAGTDPVDATAIGALGSDQRGLGGIEVALFGDDPTGARSCTYAASAAELVAATAATLADDWAAGVDTSTQQFIEELVNGIVFALGRLSPTCGSDRRAAPPPALRHPPTSTPVRHTARSTTCWPCSTVSMPWSVVSTRSISAQSAEDHRPAGEATRQGAHEHRVDPRPAGDGDRRRCDVKRLSVDRRGAPGRPIRRRQPARRDAHAR